MYIGAVLVTRNQLSATAASARAGWFHGLATLGAVGDCER